MSTRKQPNKYVSKSTLTRAEKAFLKDLTVKVKTPSTHGNSKALCWDHVGKLFYIVDNIVVDESRYYCSICLESEKLAPGGGHISRVSSFSLSTSTANINLHLSVKHNINEAQDKKVSKVLDYFKKYSSGQKDEPTTSAASTHEFTRDLVLWLCRDLLPFEMVLKDGMKSFFEKNVPQFELPSPATLSTTALNDVYLAAITKVKSLMTDVKSACVMFDSWTDKYRGRNYLGLRLSFVQNWQYHVVTISCKVLFSHKSVDIAEHVRRELKEFFPDIKKIMLTSCHDGASNMVKTSKLLKVTHYQHCSAHALHLLLTVDSIDTVADVVELLKKCREMVTVMHFKAAIVEEELASVADKEMIIKLQRTISEAQTIVELDSQYPLSTDEDSDAAEEGEQHENQHRHQSLKGSCPTRWNSAFEMIDAIVDLKNELQNSLKRIGHSELCLGEAEFSLLTDLRDFMKPFKNFTDIVSCNTPTLSVVPVIKLKIKNMCKPDVHDDECIKLIKIRILRNIDKRFPETNASKIHQLLDPETKNLIPRHEASVLLEEAIKDAVSRQLVEVQLPDRSIGSPSEGNPHSTDDNDSPSCKKLKLRQQLINEMQMAIAAQNPNDNEISSSAIAVEITNYLTMRSSHVIGDVLDFWNQNQFVYPLLSQLAQLYLSMSASSVPVESMFSTSGLIVNGKRSMLGPDKLHRISFIHDNSKFLLDA